MLADDTTSGPGFLSHYGVPLALSLALYGGTGVLTVDDGEGLPCAFEAGQLVDGAVSPLSPFRHLGMQPRSFRGTTPEGFQVAADGLRATNFLPDPPPPSGGDARSTWGAYRAQQMVVQFSKDGDARSVRFGLTNLLFDGMEQLTVARPADRRLSLSLDTHEGPTQLRIELLPSYEGAAKRLRTLRATEVTCEAAVDLPDTGDTAHLADVVDGLCHLLSVARGTKIARIYTDHYDAAGQRLSRAHSARITKRYGPLSVITILGLTDERDREATKRFVEASYPTYIARRDAYRLHQGTIDAYLDAKAEGDYLEARGVKLTVALEMLKAVFLQQPDAPVKAFIIDEGRFDRELAKPLRKAVDAELAKAGVDEASRQESTGKIKELTRTSFKPLLRGLCAHVELAASDREIARFVDCRNALVHQGRFFPEVATGAKRSGTPFRDVVDEYFFLVNFLDRVFLRLPCRFRAKNGSSAGLVSGGRPAPGRRAGAAARRATISLS